MDNFGIPGYTTASLYGYDGQGHADWTGTFKPIYPFASVNQITANWMDGSNLVLTEGVHYSVNAATDEITILTGLDLHVVNELWVDGVNNSLNGWPYINYPASSIQSVYVDMMNGTARYGVGGLGCFQTPPPCEWWFEPDWPWEVEGWWALGYFCPDTFCWPPGSMWWVNYTSPAYLTIDYNAEPDPRPYYMEWPGTVDEFLALADGNCTMWHEVYPTYCNMWHCIDTDPLVPSNIITFELDGMVRDFQIVSVAIDIEVTQKPCVQDIDPGADYYTDPRYVEIGGFPHPERDFSPWFGREFGVPLPNEVEHGEYTSCYKVLGRQIDLYVCDYPDPYGGQGPNRPADLFWPQKEVCLCANVTYNLWPEQNKDVAFQIIDPYGETYALLCARTNEVGVAMICFRLPWMCDDPEYYFGEWCVIATVDIACIHVNDTMCFKYDYMGRLWKKTEDKSSYLHGECIEVTIDYGSAAMMTYDVLITVVGLDETGVPFDFGYVWVTIGGAEYCTYNNGTTTVIICIPKWARAGRAEIHVNMLWPDLPQNGGAQQGPPLINSINIEADSI
jgi:hypothetical protein